MTQASAQSAALAPSTRSPSVLAVAVFFAVTLSCGLVYLLLTATLGPSPFDPGERLGVAPQSRTTFVLCALYGFLIAVRYYERNCGSHLAALQPHTDLTPAAFRELTRPREIRPSTLRWARGIGALVAIGIIPASASDSLFFLDPGAWDAGLVFTLAINLLVFTLMAGTVVGMAAGRGSIERVLDSLGRFDLLDRSITRPFGRLGLRQAFYWVGGSSLASLLALDLDRIAALLAILAGTLVMATLSFLGPARPIRDRVRHEKRVELSALRERIAAAKDNALGRTSGGPGAAELPGLLAYEARLRAIPEWPFDTGTRLRFAAVVALAVGSWLGGALVERALAFVL